MKTPSTHNVLGAPGEALRWKAFGDWIKTERLSLQVGAREFARAAGISPSTLLTLEGGGRLQRGQWRFPAPADTTLVQIAEVLGIDPNEVRSRAGYPPLDFENVKTRVDAEDVRAKADAMVRARDAGSDADQLMRLRGKVEALYELAGAILRDIDRRGA